MKIVNLVHDEIVVEHDIELSDIVLSKLKECMRRAGAAFIKSLVMKSGGKTSHYWTH